MVKTRHRVDPDDGQFNEFMSLQSRSTRTRQSAKHDTNVSQVTFVCLDDDSRPWALAWTWLAVPVTDTKLCRGPTGTEVLQKLSHLFDSVRCRGTTELCTLSSCREGTFREA